MTIIRIVHNQENPYVQLNKKALWNENLSLKAVGLWARCMSRPDDWRFNIEELVKKCKEGRKAVDSAIQELIRHGYALRIEHWDKSEDGKFKDKGFEYVFFEFPATEEDKNKILEELKKSFRYCCFGNLRGGNFRNGELLNTENTHLSNTSKIDIEKNRDNRKQRGNTAATLPSSTKKTPPPKKFSTLSQEEKQFINEMLDFNTPIGNDLDYSFLTAMLERHGLERVKKAWEFCIAKEIKSSLGGLMRKACEGGWELPDTESVENKRLCQELASRFPGRLNITQNYLTFPEMGRDIYFNLPRSEVQYQLERFAKFLGAKQFETAEEEVYEMGDFE